MRILFLFVVSFNALAINGIKDARVVQVVQDKELFTKSACNVFMSKKQDVLTYLACATEISSEEWKNYKPTFGCIAKGALSKNSKVCLFSIQDGGRGLLDCEGEKLVHMSCKKEK